jgi:hypothetical protein
MVRGAHDMPEVVFLGPTLHKVPHKLLFLRVLEQERDGRITKLSVIADVDRASEVGNQEGLLYAYFPQSS